MEQWTRIKRGEVDDGLFEYIQSKVSAHIIGDSVFIPYGNLYHYKNSYKLNDIDIIVKDFGWKHGAVQYKDVEGDEFVLIPIPSANVSWARDAFKLAIKICEDSTYGIVFYDYLDTSHFIYLKKYNFNMLD